MEEPWTNLHEELLLEWKTNCEEFAKKHSKKAMKCKLWHQAIKLPSVIIPVIMAPITNGLKDYEYISQINTVGFILSAFLNAYYNFYDFQEKKEKHDQHASHYYDLVTTIDVVLSRGRTFREPADRFFERIQAEIDILERTSPDIYY